MVTLKRVGFTLVELLVSITVIGILAGLSFMVYNGAQANARNSQTALAIKAYKDALNVYRQDNGAYPSTGGTPTKVCLGDDYPSNTCWDGATTELGSFNTALAGSLGQTLPMPGVNLNRTWNGAAFIPSGLANKLDGVDTDFIAYTVEGTTTRCPVGPVATNTGAKTYTGVAPSTGYTLNTLGIVQCWVPMPNP